VLGRIARERRCDVVLHESFPAPRLAAIPLVLTVHDLRALDPESRAASLARRFVAPAVIRRSLERASRIVVVSRFTGDAVVRAAPRTADRIAVVANAADHLAPPSSPPPRIDGLVLAVGHLERRKGVDVLLEAFARLHARAPRTRLRFAGSGPMGGILARRVRALGVASAVTIEPVEERDLPRLYAEASLVAVPSRYEGFGLSVLEAMRCGTPVVAANASALPETAGGAACLVDGFDPESWARTLETVLADGDLALALAARGRARAASFTWRDSARALVDVLGSAASAKS